jgi:hypothetical protein
VIQSAALCIPISQFVPRWHLRAVSFFVGSCEMSLLCTPIRRHADTPLRRHVPHPYQRNLTIDKVLLKG